MKTSPGSMLDCAEFRINSNVLMQGEVPEQITRRKDHSHLYDKKEHRWAFIWRRHVAPSRRLGNSVYQALADRRDSVSLSERSFDDELQPCERLLYIQLVCTAFKERRQGATHAEVLRKACAYNSLCHLRTTGPAARVRFGPSTGRCTQRATRDFGQGCGSAGSRADCKSQRFRCTAGADPLLLSGDD